MRDSNAIIMTGSLRRMGLLRKHLTDNDDGMFIQLMGLLRTRKPLRFAITAILVAFMASNRYRSYIVTGANSASSLSMIAPEHVSCNASDPEAVAVCLKEKGMESIFHRLPKNASVDDPWKVTLFARLDRMRLACGTLCQLNTQEAIKNHTEANPKGTLPLVRVPDVDCVTLLGMEDIDAGADGDVSVPQKIPDELYDYFTIGRSYGRKDLWLRSDVYLGVAAFSSVWTKEDIQSKFALLSKGKLRGTYGETYTNSLRDKLVAYNLTNKSVLVIGSERPWVEVICLYAGARHVTTLEYGKIVSHHPQISTMTPDEFRIQYKNAIEQADHSADFFFDGIVSHSSLEHSGLGRYGDALNPWGDILAVARAWCVAKNDPSSFMFLGVPTGKDMIVSNWHRVYGKVRWPLLATNWRHVDHTNPLELEQSESVGAKGGGFVYHFEKVVP